MKSKVINLDTFLSEEYNFKITKWIEQNVNLNLDFNGVVDIQIIYNDFLKTQILKYFDKKLQECVKEGLINSYKITRHERQTGKYQNVFVIRAYVVNMIKFIEHLNDDTNMLQNVKVLPKI